MSLVGLDGVPIAPRMNNSALESAADANPGEMSERVMPRMQGDYVVATWAGVNSSGVEPIGKNVLVKMDQFKTTMGATNLKWHDAQIERANLGAESGTIYAIGDQAFAHNNDLTANMGLKPVTGDRIYCEKYAGREIMGDDGNKYRLMADSCIAGLYRGLSPVIQESK